MDAPTTIAVKVSAATLATMTTMAADRGVSIEQLASEMLREALDDLLAEERDLLGSLAEAEADFEVGRVLAHDQVKHMFGVPQDQRDAA